MDLTIEGSKPSEKREFCEWATSEDEVVQYDTFVEPIPAPTLQERKDDVQNISEEQSEVLHVPTTPEATLKIDSKVQILNDPGTPTDRVMEVESRHRRGAPTGQRCSYTFLWLVSK